MVRHEREIRQHRARRHDLRPRYDQAFVRLLLDVNADVGDFVRRAVAIDGRMDDRVIDERNALLAEAIPITRVRLIRVIELSVGAERGEERGLVVGRAADPTISEARPFGDRVAAGDQVVHRLGRFEKGMREAAVAGVARQEQFMLAAVVVQRVVEARDHPCGVAKSRMRRDVPDALAVDIDFAPIAQLLEIFLAGHRRKAGFRRPARRLRSRLGHLAPSGSLRSPGREGSSSLRCSHNSRTGEARRRNGAPQAKSVARSHCGIVARLVARSRSSP